MSAVTLKNVVKKYGDLQVIHNVDLQIEDGEFCVLVGPSGCGKSTLLRMIAGLEEITSGSAHIGSRDVTNIDASDRGVAMVFQTYALYPHMTVEQNMGFGLRMSGVPKKEIEEKVSNAAKILQLEPYLKRKPKALSGGQRQRVAIGRAIVRGPEVFLFDEPLSNLDAELRVDMRVELSQLHADMGATMIYVTHDQVEAMTLADKIVVLRAGVIEQVGSPMALYEDPDNKFVAGFIGSPSMNFFVGKVADGGVALTALGNRTLATEATLPASGSVIAGVRPQHLIMTPAEEGAKVTLIEQLGDVSYVYLNTPSGDRLIAQAGEGSTLAKGDTVALSCDPDKVYLFDAKTEQRLR